MAEVKMELDHELLEVLERQGQPPERAARELMVSELYRRHAISSGKAARLLGMNRFDFIRHASSLGIPYFDMSDDEWDRERSRLEAL